MVEVEPCEVPSFLLDIDSVPSSSFDEMWFLGWSSGLGILFFIPQLWVKGCFI